MRKRRTSNKTDGTTRNKKQDGTGKWMKHFNKNIQVGSLKSNTLDYCQVTERNELLIRTTASKNSNGIRLNEQKQS